LLETLTPERLAPLKKLPWLGDEKWTPPGPADLYTVSPDARTQSDAGARDWHDERAVRRDYDRTHAAAPRWRVQLGCELRQHLAKHPPHILYRERPDGSWRSVVFGAKLREQLRRHR
jgi:hypothetical protein